MATRWTSKHTGQKIDDTIDYVTNPNLLDNWYFGNPVDQRGGYVVPSGTQIYGDSALTNTYPGVTEAWRNVEYVNSTYCIYRGTTGSCTYYIKTSDAVRGYTGAGYGIDRWKSGNSNLTINLTGEGIGLISGSAASYFYQYFDGGISIEDSYTISALVEAIAGTAYLQAIYADGTYGTAMKLTTGLNALTVRATKTISRVLFQINSGSSVTVKAAKLELGSQQTLAHQDENGNWVLNEIPDYGEQLRRFQRYFIRLLGYPNHFAGSTGNGNHIEFFIPGISLRDTPAVSGLTNVSIRYSSGASNTTFTLTAIAARAHGVYISGNVASVGNASAYSVISVASSKEFSLSADL